MSQADWSNFFVAQCGAAAALIGLLFVALSINLQRIMSESYLVDRVAESILVFLGLLWFSIFGMVPHQSLAVFGAETLASGIVVWALTTKLHVAAIRRHPSQVKTKFLIQRIVQTQIATLSTIVAGILMLAGHDSGLFWLIPASVVAYAAGIANAWVLTVEILR